MAQLRALAEQMGFDPADVKFVLLDLAEQVMPEVGKKLGEGAMRVLRQGGIDVRLGLTLKEVHSDHVVLSDDSRIDTHAVAWVPDLTQPGKITSPTAQHAIRQGKVLGRNVAASLGYGRPKNYRHRNMGLVVDLGRRYAVANPLNIHLSGYAAKFVTRMYHLCAIPRLVNRWAVSLSYLADMFFERSVVSVGLSTQDDARFSTSEGIPLPKAD